MDQGKAVTSEQSAPATEALQRLSREQTELLKRTICKGATDDELALFVQVCNAKRLDPFSGEIHAVKRWDNKEKREVMAIQIGIDGFRGMAEDTGRYSHQDPPLWCDATGQWFDVWLLDEAPAAAKVAVYRIGVDEPFVGVAKFSEYVQRKKDGTPTHMWTKMPSNMIAKCAESLALRKAFPRQLAGVYTHEEMAQADTPPEAPRVAMPQPVERDTGSSKTVITAVEEQKAGDRTVYLFKGIDGETYGTFSTELAAQASPLVNKGVEVEVEYQLQPNGRRKLLAINE
jgi:phage recombination protein Bet